MLPEERENQKQLDREVREMVSVLTHRLADLQTVHKHPSSSRHHDEDANDDHHDDDDDGDHGVRIITLAGSNTGATMKGDVDDKSASQPHHFGTDHEPLSAYVNSNFQAINNSIMLGGSYTTNDPGVHLDISDLFEGRHDHKGNKHGRKEKKKKDEEHPKSDQHTEHST